jgi:hypothetical protein
VQLLAVELAQVPGQVACQLVIACAPGGLLGFIQQRRHMLLLVQRLADL